MFTFSLVCCQKILKKYVRLDMILKKMIIGFFCLNFLNGCVQNVAFLGPALTGASTGSLYQATLSYGSDKVVKKITGKTTTENIISIVSQNKDEKEVDQNDDIFFKLIKEDINKISGIRNLSNP